MVEVKHSNSPWIYLAYSFITLSYLNVNILYIRLFLICASVSFIVFAIVVGNVFVDSLVFNSVFIIINGTYSYFLFIKYLPVKLTPLEEKIYKNDFSRVMDRRTFRDLIRKAYLRSFSEGGQITHHGNNFSGLFYVALINPNHKVTYIKKGREYFEIKENSWIGVVEYTMYEKEKKKIGAEIGIKSSKTETEENIKKKELHIKEKKIKVKWGLDAIVKECGEIAEINEEIYLQEDDACYVYEFPLAVLEKLFLDKDEGVLWKNALYSMWLGYTTKAIINVDEKVRKQMQRKKIGAISQIIEGEEYSQTARSLGPKSLGFKKIEHDQVPSEEDELNYERYMGTNTQLLSPNKHSQSQVEQLHKINNGHQGDNQSPHHEIDQEHINLEVNDERKFK
jgi:hypothetical protein